MRKKRPNNYYDYSLVAAIILLSCFGLLMLYSTSSYTAKMDLFKKQLIISAVFLVGAIVISKLDYHLLRLFPMIFYMTALIGMCLVHSPIGIEANGAKRWIQIGPIQIQPSEMGKLAVIVTLSYLIVQMGRNFATRKGCLLLLLIGGLQALFAFVITDNLSTGIIIGGITVSLIFLAHPKTKPFLKMFAAIAAVAVVALVLVYYLMDITVVERINKFRVWRIFAWLHPEEVAGSVAYQTMQGLYAVGSGGFFGKGLGNSVQKLGPVPEAQNDMIFAIICEELGVFGGAIILILFAYLLYRLFFIAQNAPDLFGSLLVSGIFIHIALQVILNISVVIGLIPPTGVTLPFISYGGTAIVFLMAEMGVALSVSRQMKFERI